VRLTRSLSGRWIRSWPELLKEIFSPSVVTTSMSLSYFAAMIFWAAT
jgi:hypothetical protein